MHYKASVGLDEAQGAVEAMLSEVRSHPEKYWQHGCFAVVDEHGKLVAFARMDSTHQLGPDVAIRKAWTAAMGAQDNHALGEMLKNFKVALPEFLEGATSIAGGVAIVDPREIPGQAAAGTGHAATPFKTSCIGAIGVGAVGSPDRDLEIAEVGLKYIQHKLWPEP
jgi:uncharacterized protein GlcG (DUF336 family)